MDPIALLPFIVLIGAMFLMTRSAKKKQRQAMQMRDQMQPGTGVRTIGGMYAVVKEVRDDAVLLEIEPGVHALFAKNAIGAVLGDEEFDRIVGGHEGEELDGDVVVPDDASSLTGGESGTKADLTKKDGGEAPADDAGKGGSGKDEPAEDTLSEDAKAGKADEAGKAEQDEKEGDAGAKDEAPRKDSEAADTTKADGTKRDGDSSK
ncbi:MULTISPECIES: preprotein translocase subunit YajC [unclassified Streptomyces]|uniref:preprotein translocase subunit YajC n=1 Tax=unclassified Streptomyces TaxID=2593676 RepID=UPI00099BBECD|nr:MULTISPECIES: preprotein translocase subunit YajC [unclassified Streptomyces]QHF94477.1 preprotein translocase subunit YajC [Streptomyces sp. NHF165]